MCCFAGWVRLYGETFLDDVKDLLVGKGLAKCRKNIQATVVLVHRAEAAGEDNLEGSFLRRETIDPPHEILAGHVRHLKINEGQRVVSTAKHFESFFGAGETVSRISGTVQDLDQEVCDVPLVVNDDDACGPLLSLLFGVLWRSSDHGMADLPKHPVMQRWWAHMADVMETKPDNEPVAVPLETMFHMA